MRYSWSTHVIEAFRTLSKTSLGKKRPYLKFFWPVLLLIFRMGENTDQKNFYYGHFLRKCPKYASVCHVLLNPSFPFFDPPENIRKLLVLWCFQGDQKGALGKQRLRSESTLKMEILSGHSLLDCDITIWLKQV